MVCPEWGGGEVTKEVCMYRCVVCSGEESRWQVLTGASLLRQQWARHTQPKVHLSETDDEEGTGRESHKRESCSSPGRNPVWGDYIELLQFWQTSYAALSEQDQPPAGERSCQVLS